MVMKSLVLEEQDRWNRKIIVNEIPCPRILAKEGQPPWRARLLGYTTQSPSLWSWYGVKRQHVFI
jgi:hypothetical protein